MRWFLMALKKYAVFSGRARRREYWMFVLFYLLIAFALGVVDAALGLTPAGEQSGLVAIYQLATLVPLIAVAVRRMHDTDHSGWWVLVPLVNLFFAVTAGQIGDNRFGPDPKQVPAEPFVAARPPTDATGPGPSDSAQGQVASRFCSRCGTRFPEGAAFCPSCGAPRSG
jgi:uncharacterized membrane protein YhaH (DUF805 family)